MEYADKVRRWQRRDRRKLALVLAVFLGLPLCLGLLSLLGHNSPEVPDTGNATDAWGIAKQFAAERLKSPGTANFGRQLPEEVVTPLGKGRYRVSAWVDSQNSFGALLRTRFVCVVVYTGNDQWRLEEIQFLE